MKVKEKALDIISKAGCEDVIEYAKLYSKDNPNLLSICMNTLLEGMYDPNYSCGYDFIIRELYRLIAISDRHNIRNYDWIMTYLLQCSISKDTLDVDTYMERA